MQFIVGVYYEEGPPVPIPNTVVKLFSAENTWREAAWENRSTLTSLNLVLIVRGLFFCLFFTEGGIEQVVEHISQNEKISVKEKKNFFETLKEIINKIVDVIKKHVTNNHLSASEKAVEDMSLDDVKRLRTQFLDVIDGAIANLENVVEIKKETNQGRSHIQSLLKNVLYIDCNKKELNNG